MGSEDHSCTSPSSRDKILEVAEARFAQRGYTGVGLRELAAGVGLGKSSLFHHFPTKAHLYLEVLERVLRRIAAQVAPQQQGEGAPADKLERWLDALISALAEQPATARLLLRALFEDDALPEEAAPQREAVERALAAIVVDFQSIVREGVADGSFRHVSVAHATQTMIGVAVYHFASGELGEGMIGAPLFSASEVSRRKREVRDFVLGGLRASEALQTARRVAAVDITGKE